MSGQCSLFAHSMLFRCVFHAAQMHVWSDVCSMLFRCVSDLFRMHVWYSSDACPMSRMLSHCSLNAQTMSFQWILNQYSSNAQTMCIQRSSMLDQCLSNTNDILKSPKEASTNPPKIDITINIVQGHIFIWYFNHYWYEFQGDCCIIIKKTVDSRELPNLPREQLRKLEGMA